MIHAYLTKPLYLNELLYEITASHIIDDKFVLSANLQQPAFALDIWPYCELIGFSSISDAVKQLKSRSLRWAYYGLKHFRRGALIANNLKLIKKKDIIFKETVLQAFSIFTLLNENQLLICREPWKKIPGGEVTFVENKIIPPNRAYLKLWEALTLLGEYPTAGELCLDLGASPGGWSWVLAECGANVIAIDKAPLDPEIAGYSNITFQGGSAFTLEPKNFDRIDWLCSDVICYPDRALTLIEKWLASDKVKHLICTIKLQGETDWQIIKKLQAIKKGKLAHLFNNKHELTFLWPVKG